MGASNRYALILERIFFAHYEEYASQVEFEREEMVNVATDLASETPLATLPLFI